MTSLTTFSLMPLPSMTIS
jgi:hypothetical protein